jgi:hypothetical protein
MKFLKLSAISLATAGSIMTTLYSIDTHNVCVGVIAFMVVVAGVFSLYEFDKQEFEKDNLQ